MRYPIVLLDVGETLIAPRESFGAVYASIWRELGLERTADEFESGLRSVWESMSRTIPPGVDRYGYFHGGEDEFWSRFCRAAVGRVDGGDAVGEPTLALGLERLREAFRSPGAWTVHSDVPDALERLRAAGARLGVVSNWDSRLPALLDALELTPWFDAIGVSHLVGCEKPDPELFRHVLRELGAPAADALHVGDVPELDGAGAWAAGVDALIVDRRGRAGGGAGSHDVVPNLTTLPERALG